MIILTTTTTTITTTVTITTTTGEIEFRCQWKERAFEDDVILEQKKKKFATRLQAWSRRIAALSALKKIKVDKSRFMVLIHSNGECSCSGGVSISSSSSVITATINITVIVNISIIIMYL